MSSAGISPRAYEAQSPQLALDGAAPVTNEGVGDEHDFYETPAHCTRAILPFLPACSSVLDPGAGKGAILREFDNAYVKRHAIEISSERCARVAGDLSAEWWDCRDALDIEPWPHVDLICMNPPFSLAEAFVRRALHEAAPQRATVAALLRLAFLESAQRIALHREHPSDVFVFANRPSFIDPDAFRPCPRCKGGAAPRAGEEKCVRCKGKTQIKGGSDSTAYAWFVWGPGRGGRWQVLDASNPDKKIRGVGRG